MVTATTTARATPSAAAAEAAAAEAAAAEAEEAEAAAAVAAVPGETTGSRGTEPAGTAAAAAAMTVAVAPPPPPPPPVEERDAAGAATAVAASSSMLASTGSWSEAPDDVALTKKFRVSLMFYTKELMANARQYGEADKLALYGLFKQAKWGDCPAGLVMAQRGNPVGSVKVRAWVTNRGKPTAQAMQEFIVVLGRVSPGWESRVVISGNSDTSSNTTSTPSGTAPSLLNTPGGGGGGLPPGGGEGGGGGGGGGRFARMGSAASSVMSSPDGLPTLVGGGARGGAVGG
ncbi:unnamed protein product, partial [Ectocarpus sp. 12 AP-2014]